jgi:quercetin dioxygenase-like cupin family protein
MTVMAGGRIRVGDVEGWVRTDPDAPFNIIEFSLVPGDRPSPRHVHDRIFEADYVLEGRVLARVGDRSEVHEAGTIVSLQPGTPHSLVAHEGPARLLAVHFPGAAAMDMFETLGRAFDERPSPEELAKHLQGLDIRFVGEEG